MEIAFPWTVYRRFNLDKPAMNLFALCWDAEVWIFTQKWQFPKMPAMKSVAYTEATEAHFFTRITSPFSKKLVRFQKC